MDTLHLPQTLVDETAYSSCRLSLRIFPDTLTSLTISPGIYDTAYDLVTALDDIFSATVQGGKVELGDRGRVVFSAGLPFAFSLGESPEAASLRLPLLLSLGFDPSETEGFSTRHEAARRPEGLWSWPTMDASQPGALSVAIHSLVGAHGGGQTVFLGSAQTAGLVMSFLDDEEVRAWREWLMRAVLAPLWRVSINGAALRVVRPVLDAARMEDALGTPSGLTPPYWRVSLMLREEVTP